MIYLDNAATTRIKPDCVYSACDYYLREIAVSPGRGSYALGIKASRMLYQARCTVAKYFGIGEPNVIFTKNSTEAINLFFNGFLAQGDHVLITCYEHNAVLRPLQTLKNKGTIDYTVISRDDLLLNPADLYRKYVRTNTKLYVSTLASNLTGRVIYNADTMAYMKEKGITTFVDASQGAAKISLNSDEFKVDYIAFTGHKDLLGIPGIGGLACEEVPKWSPLIQGGTGVLGDNYINPSVFPEGYEAGTLNMPAIWSLKVAIEWLTDNQERLIEKEKVLTAYFVKELKKIANVILYDEEFDRVGVIGLNIKNIKSNELVKYLDENNICVRGGMHCAILAHEALNTKESGVVRFSLSWTTTKDEIDKVLSVIRKVSEKNVYSFL